VISDDGIIVDKYRDRKLLERYLESAALKHDMTMEELSLLLYLKDASHELSRKNLADLMDLSRGDLAVAVQRLSAKKMVEVTELPRRRGTERKIRLELLPASEVVIPDLEAAENDYYQAKFGNFTEEEIRQYTLLARKVRENERSILQRG
jgi:DNA-binding MarR family transcriptional regulator